tara:strand:- start:4058 stop:4183 length:126 start_codon:yes stop_codon:yes gene_type:complete
MQKVSTILRDFLPACRNIIFLYFYVFSQNIAAKLANIFKKY